MTNNTYLYQISSGQGPTECELAVKKFFEYLKKTYHVTEVSHSDGYDNKNYRSIMIESEYNLNEFVGSIKWICESPYRPKHKRKNWFIDFSSCNELEEITLDESKVKFETFRCGGKGGQNVNKVETGVRAIYLPTGQSVVCEDERSQYLNRRKALQRLEIMVNEINSNNKSQLKKENWSCHNNLERGNASIVFRGLDFIREK